MSTAADLTVRTLVAQRNADKALFTAGPASLLAENLTGLRPCFGRGDADYAALEERVLGALRALSGHAHIARLQGSATLAIEIATLNFLQGRVLVLDSGYYAERLHALAQVAQQSVGQIRHIDLRPWNALDSISGTYDWVLACYTETSQGIRLPIQALRQLADRTQARLFLDATASIGLEDHHELADVIAYSSCKGLFGLTGAAFVAFNTPPQNEVASFYLNLQTHLDKKVTGPYHAIASLDEVLPQHGDFRHSVLTNKARFCRELAAHLTQPPANQPALCTHVTANIRSAHPQAILYVPRSTLPGSVVCHLGEAHLGRAAQGDILNLLEYTA